MNDEQAFLETLRADPFDDMTRLVYADWLEERGRPDHARYLRVEDELAQLDPDWPDRAGTRTLERCHGELARLRVKLRLGPNHPWPDAAGKRYEVLVRRRKGTGWWLPKRNWMTLEAVATGLSYSAAVAAWLSVRKPFLAPLAHLHPQRKPTPPGLRPWRDHDPWRRRMLEEDRAMYPRHVRVNPPGHDEVTRRFGRFMISSD